jgi:hypothetical protein
LKHCFKRSSRNLLNYFLGAKTMEHEAFVAGGVTAQQLHPAAAAIQLIREEFN